MKLGQIGILSLFLVATACAPKHNPTINEVAPNTGDPSLEASTSLSSKDQVNVGQVYYVQTAQLNVRTAPAIDPANLAGTLTTNDQIKILDKTPAGDFVEMELVKSNAVLKPAPKYYISFRYLDLKPLAVPPGGDPSKYLIIENLATERMRVYERCQQLDCPNKMILEAKIIVGQDEDGTRSAVGHYHIDQWVKFYEDGAREYPAWYNPNYPPVPPPHSWALEWHSSEYMPNGKGDMRGAFGWYTALMTPNAYAQWLHGTMGWGADKTYFIDLGQDFWANLFVRTRSHGCTRTDNETIALVRQLVPAGSTVLKVYAQEALRDLSLANYPTQTGSWNYILTKNGFGRDGQRADREEVLAAGTTQDQWIEAGTHTYNMRPKPVPLLTDGGDRKLVDTGDIYGIGAQNFHGYFIVDEGRFFDYQHPAQVRVGGYPGPLPQFVMTNDQNFTVPRPASQSGPYSHEHSSFN